MIQKWHYAGHYWHHSPSRRTFYGGLLRYNYYIAGDLIEMAVKNLSFPTAVNQNEAKWQRVKNISYHCTYCSWRICIFEKVVECCIGFVKWLYETILPTQQTKKVWNENQNHHFTTAQFGILDFRNERSLPSGKLSMIKMTTDLNILWMMK